MGELSCWRDRCFAVASGCLASPTGEATSFSLDLLFSDQPG